LYGASSDCQTLKREQRADDFGERYLANQTGKANESLRGEELRPYVLIFVVTNVMQTEQTPRRLRRLGLMIDLASHVLSFLRKERINMKFRIVTDSEFWLEGPYGFLTAKFNVDRDGHQVSYDLFSPKYDVHLKEEALRDVERLDMIVEERGEWDYEKSIEELWLVLDCVKLWAWQKGFAVKGEEPI
jgi:hypothetical protein